MAYICDGVATTAITTIGHDCTRKHGVHKFRLCSRSSLCFVCIAHFAFSGSTVGVTRSSLATLSMYLPITSSSKLFWMLSAVTSASEMHQIFTSNSKTPPTQTHAYTDAGQAASSGHHRDHQFRTRFTAINKSSSFIKQDATTLMSPNVFFTLRQITCCCTSFRLVASFF